ncbi:fibrinogen-like protein 1-like protein [Spea bombifrons]|uniref:fibrinogen-like protein 1-like protein n=1 Tax=Spea bombifrons TaxID=233779 RepID=UPI00234B8137|nr:fibrinogen-like protein 1-like protein [Spea bombifrons]
MLRITCFLLLVNALRSAAQDVKALGIANIDMVPNVTKVLNLKDVFSRKVFYTRDCDELYRLGHRQNGLYVIRPEGSPKLVVQCFMYDCAGWTVIQRNSFNTEITWSESWTTYKYGYGNIESDHWLGNHYIHLLTAQKWNKVRIDLVSPENEARHAEYDSFYVTGEDEKYRLRLGTYSGDAGDSMTSGALKNMHDNMRFSTHDNDNDRRYNANCADEHGGGWWYDFCYDAQLNKKNGIHWETLCDHNCKRSVMMIKPVHMYCYRA